MKRLHVLFCAGMVALASCLKTDPDPFPPQPVVPQKVATVHFTVKPRWAGAPFDKTVIYTNVLGHRILVQDLKFYLGDMILQGAGEDALMKDIDIFKVVDGPVERYYTAAPGTYDHLHFGVGVPEALNHTDPATYPNSHPLSAVNGMFWTWASLYRFVIFDGRFDTLPGAGTPPFQFSIHTGRDTCYREVQLPAPLVLALDDTVDLVLNVDIDRFFYNATDTFALNEGSQWHGEASQIDIGLKFSDLVSGSFSVQ